MKGTGEHCHLEVRSVQLGLLLLDGGPERQQGLRHGLPRLPQHVDELPRPRLVGLPAEERVRRACPRSSCTALSPGPCRRTTVDVASSHA